jgi:hypothetical protein
VALVELALYLRCAVRFVLSACVFVASVAPALAQQNDLLSDKLAARLLVPAYVFPGTVPGSAERKYWDALIAAAGPDCPIVAVINPASGPIDRTTPEMEPTRIRVYTDLLVRAAKENKHLKFVMYVSLANSKTKQIGMQVEFAVRSDATGDIDEWLKHYPPDKHPNLIGFFLDEHPAFDKEQLASARKVRDHAAKKLPGGVVFLNVGRANGGAAILSPDLPNEVALLWEAPASANLKDKFALPAWTEEKVKGAPVFPRHRFAVLVHSKARLDGEFVRLINDPPPTGKRIGWFYVTDGEVGRNRHPWDQLPPYWGELVKAVRAQNAAGPK